tara:strand:+ start:32 stop:616 length:585 start_codon:yes stop_codon:yes gene_type:complete
MALFGKQQSRENKETAKAEYEKACELAGDNREIRAMRMRIGLRARAHIDKSFIEGAEKTAVYDEACLRAVAAGREKPTPPKVTMYQKVKSASGEVTTYIPEEIAEEAFKIGAKYQLTEIEAKPAIDLVQNLANTTSYELHLDEPLVAVYFLREEHDYFPTDEQETDDPVSSSPEQGVHSSGDAETQEKSNRDDD